MRGALCFPNFMGGIMNRRPRAEKSPRSQYVITQRAGGVTAVSTLLRKDPEVVILDEIDYSTALAEMSEETHQRIQREFPNLVIEPNNAYTLLTR